MRRENGSDRGRGPACGPGSARSLIGPDFRDTADALFDGRPGALDWAETRGLAEGNAAFADIRAGRVAAPKIILRPDQG